LTGANTAKQHTARPFKISRPTHKPHKPHKNILRISHFRETLHNPFAVFFRDRSVVAQKELCQFAIIRRNYP